MRKRFTATLLGFLLRKMRNKRIWLTYDANAKTDGTGAQIQRILAISAVALDLGFSYIHTGISDIAVHPLDPYQDVNSRRDFVAEVNHVFELPSDDLPQQIHLIEIYSLNSLKLFCLTMRAILSGGKYLLKVGEPFSIIDHRPEIYRLAISNLVNWNSFLDSIPPLHKAQEFVGVHYRQGVGGMAIQDGEKVPRELPSSYFVKAIHQYISRKMAVIIFTDAPKENLVFTIPDDQIQLWKTNPGVMGSTMKINASDLSLFNMAFPEKVEIISGGNPLFAIGEMSKAPYLIIGRSSLSYIAALLNSQGTIIYPPGFWHPPLKSWIRA
jgi:hypothetical protein